ncbi:MAG: bifunctional oligoribonuclease/PAP phosphatase NrnA [Treponema sp.]|nr:bifunctional oligoribonuclease/PAP phosphatase NrnA [Treponema sp.]
MISLSQEQIESFKVFIDKYGRFVVIGHKEPDGDCMASSLGVSYILEHFGKECILLNAGPFKRSEVRQFAPLFKAELPFMSEQDRRGTGLIIVDCSELSRLGDELKEQVKDLDSFIIDHHKTASVEGSPAIIDPTSPAAALLVQQLYEALVGKPTAEHAKTLFFGLSTDTGFFRYLGSKDAEVFRAAARLVQAGSNPRETYQTMTGGKGWNTRKLLGIILNRAEHYLSGKLVVSYESQEDTKRYGQEGRDSDAFYSLMLAVEGVEAVAFVRQDSDSTCTLGLRSKDRVDVSVVASKFGGGGHKNASGASCEGKVETLIPALVKEFARQI